MESVGFGQEGQTEADYYKTKLYNEDIQKLFFGEKAKVFGIPCFNLGAFHVVLNLKCILKSRVGLIS